MGKKESVPSPEAVPETTPEAASNAADSTGAGTSPDGISSSAPGTSSGTSSVPVAGNLHVANDVLADIVGKAAMDCYGVVDMASPRAKASSKTAPKRTRKTPSASHLRHGVVIENVEEGIHVDLYVVIEHGTNIATVSQNLKDQVSFALKEYARVPLAGVEVHVQDVRVSSS